MTNEKITIEEYQEFTQSTFIVPDSVAESYLAFGLVAEAGELAGQYAKYLRNDFDFMELDKRVRKELGDMMYFIVQLCNYYEWDVRDVMQENKDKLLKRLRENKIRGDGDMR